MFAGFHSVSESHDFLLLICHHICDHPIVWLWKHGSIWLNWFHSLWCLRTKSWMFGKTILVQILCRNCSLWCLMQHICEFAVWGNQFQNKYSHIFGNKYPLCVQQILSNVSKQIPSMCATNTIKRFKTNTLIRATEINSGNSKAQFTHLQSEFLFCSCF